jgi:hypothetical protein
MAFKPFTRKATIRQVGGYLDNVSDLSLAYNYAIDPKNGHKCSVSTIHKGPDYSYCITDNVDACREYYLTGIRNGNLIISENILDHVVCHDAHKCLLLLTEIDIKPTERSLELSAIYGHIHTMLAITSLGVKINVDIADISAQHGHVDMLKYIYHTERIHPTTYGLLNGILNKHCSVVDFICKLLRKNKRIPGQLRHKRSITPVSPTAIRASTPTVAAPLVLNLAHLSDRDTDSDSYTPHTVRSLSPVSVYTSDSSPRELLSLSSLSDLSSLGLSDSIFESPRSLQTPSPRGRSNSWASTYSANSSSSQQIVVTPRGRAKTPRKKTKHTIDPSTLYCKVECIEAACQTGCLHCFDKVVKNNSEYTNNTHTVMLSKALILAAQKGHLDLCRKLVKMGVELTKKVFIAAAKSGNYDLWVWLHEAGCPWSYEVYDTAMSYGFKKLGDYALEHGCGA